MISAELNKVFQFALSIICNDNDEEITCLDLFIAMPLTKHSYAGEALIRLGITEETAKSFVMTEMRNNTRAISPEAEKAILYAKEVANNYGYKNTCSHHLLLALIKHCDTKISQILVDYHITYERIKEIVEAMSHNGIGKEAQRYTKGERVKIMPRMKDKKLEKELIKQFMPINKKR